MFFPAFLRTRWAALRLAFARALQRPEKLLSLHSLLWALMAAGLALLLYVLVLIPFTPGIRDIRKAKTEQPAQLVAADGKLLAEYRWVNRAWVPLAEIAPPVVDALIATEDHRFYKHWGLDWRRTASALVRTLGRQAGRLHHYVARA
jgi:penicillin-binding protein 1A